MLRLAALGIWVIVGATPDAGTVCPPRTTRCVDKGLKRVTEERCNDAGTAWVAVTTCVVCVDGVSCANPPTKY